MAAAPKANGKATKPSSHQPTAGPNQPTNQPTAPTNQPTAPTAPTNHPTTQPPVSLRYESRYPFAVWLAQQAALAAGGFGGAAGAGGPPDAVRRYEISHVMRAGRVRGLPATYLQVREPGGG
jgi:hypothetical protein